MKNILQPRPNAAHLVRGVGHELYNGYGAPETRTTGGGIGTSGLIIKTQGRKMERRERGKEIGRDSYRFYTH
jgi:hypothetical protein